MNLRDLVNENTSVEGLDVLLTQNFEFDTQDVPLVYALGAAERERNPLKVSTTDPNLRVEIKVFLSYVYHQALAEINASESRPRNGSVHVLDSDPFIMIPSADIKRGQYDALRTPFEAVFQAYEHWYHTRIRGEQFSNDEIDDALQNLIQHQHGMYVRITLKPAMAHFSRGIKQYQQAKDVDPLKKLSNIPHWFCFRSALLRVYEETIAAGRATGKYIRVGTWEKSVSSA